MPSNDDPDRADAGAPNRPGARALPHSMASLRAFEAVARRRSFTKAGIELNQTQTTISHQIRKLEDFLGVQLFIRERDGVRLSEHGEEYLAAVSSALDILSSSTRRILDSADDANLSIVSLAAFGLKCLLPLLPDFRARHPDIRIRFESVISFNASATYQHDVVIRYGNGDWSGLRAWKIANEELFPVCSPQFLQTHPLSTPQDIFRYATVCTSSTVFRDDWPDWLAHVGCTGQAMTDVITCDTMLSASQAAIDGLGIALGRSPLVNLDLQAGRLVEPFRQRITAGSGYYLTIPDSRPEREAVKLFRRWLLAQYGTGEPG